METPGERLVQLVGIPVLLLAYKRPQNTREIASLLGVSSPVYLFVDRDQDSSELNNSVIELALEAFSTANRQSLVYPSHLGPGKAMLRALDWVFRYEEIVLVLEDDVFPNQHAAQYWNSVKDFVVNEGLLASSRTPFQNKKISDQVHSGVSKYALTNGWILSRQIWQQFQLHQEKSLLSEFGKFICKSPLAVRTEHFYFLASALLCRKGIVKAWDSQFIFFVLLNKIKTITPNKSCVEIRGVDAVASNTLINSDTSSDIFWSADELPPTFSTSWDNQVNTIYDKEIETKIYKIRWWHVFSPMKSLIRILKH
jgi:hypothetical protein